MRKVIDFLKQALLTIFIAAFILFQIFGALILLYYLVRFLILLLPIFEPL